MDSKQIEKLTFKCLQDLQDRQIDILKMSSRWMGLNQEWREWLREQGIRHFFIYTGKV